MELPKMYREKVLEALLMQRNNFGGIDKAYAISMDINPSVYNRLKNGERDNLLSDAKYLMLGRKLGVTMKKVVWKTVSTQVFEIIQEEILFCKEHSKSKMFVDNCGIGKTYTAKYLAKTEKNIFYIDCTQCKSKRAFIKAIARAVGVELKGTCEEIKDTTKYYLQILEQAIVIVDEFGALEKSALGLLQEYWNATEDTCGWYLMGANAARNRVSRGVAKDRDYFAELYSRFSDKFSTVVPKDYDLKYTFYKKLIADVLGGNIKDKSQLNSLVNQCLIKDDDGNLSGLRRAQSLLLLHDA